MKSAVPQSHRSLRLAGGTLATAALVAIAVYSAAAGAESRHPHVQHFATTATNVVDAAPFCSPSTRCVYPFTNTSSWAGDVTASQVQAGSGVLLPGLKVKATATSVVTGTVAGCPSGGEFSLTWESDLDLLTGGGTAHAYVIPGSGSGGLATIRGSLFGVVTRGADGKPQTAYTGYLRCGDD